MIGIAANIRRFCSYICLYSLCTIGWSYYNVAHAIQSNTPYRIVHINSYHRGYSWSDGIENGISNTLSQSNLHYELSTEYLDSKRFDYREIESSLAISMQKKYAKYKPDIVLVSDNNAFNFVTNNRQQLFPDVPVIFCGYNNFTAEILNGMSNITGVNEKVDLGALAEMAISIHPRTKALAFIVSDQSPSDKNIYETSIATFDQLRMHYQVEVLLNKRQDQIAKTLALMPENSLVFIAGSTTNQGQNRKLSPAEQGQLIVDVSPFPTYTSWNFHLKTGATGGKILSGFAQGESMTRIALQVASGAHADNIPVMMATPTQDIFNYDKLLTFNVSENLLPPGAIILNKPMALWDEYKYHFIVVITLIVIQMLLILVLLVNIRKRQQALHHLDIERALLVSRVLERTQALNLANKKLERLSIEDSLTGLKNRRYLDETLTKEISSLKRTQEPLSVIMIDIDYFKQYNDIYGHIQGDHCLQAISASLNSAISRPRDMVARYGGEEFIIILPDTDSLGAEKVVADTCHNINELALEHSASPFDQKVTISVGLVTVIPSDKLHLNVSTLLVLVDKLLYRSKNNGRNQVSSLVYQEESIAKPENVTSIHSKRFPRS